MPSALLISVRPGSAPTESGLYKGTGPLDTPLWRDGQNVLFRDGGPQKIEGWSEVLTVGGSGVIRGADALQDESAIQRLFFGDATSLYMWDSATVSTLGTGFTGYADETVTHPATAWSFARFGNWMLATNGKDAPQIWKGSGSATALGGLSGNFTAADIFLKRGPHILAFGLTGNAGGNGASTFAWSDADNPETWTPSSTNAAGDLPIRDLDGGIRAAVNFSQSIAVLGKNDLLIVTYSGAPYYFTYQPALKGIGAVGKMAVVEANRILYGFGPAGVWASDGTTYEYIDTLALKQFIADTVDASQLSKVAATYDSKHEVVRWSLPTAGAKENTVTIAYRVPSKSWSIETYGRSCWVPQTGVFKYGVGFSVDRKACFHGSGVDAHTSALDAWVRTKPFGGGDARSWTYLDALSVELRRIAGPVQVRVGSQKNLDDAIAWGPYHDLETGFEKIAMRKSGRFLTVEFRSNAVGGDFALSGFDLYGSQGGRI